MTDKPLNKRVLLTNDVETTSIINNRLRDETGFAVWKEGMPRLLDIYDKYSIKSTFFFTGYIAEKFPDIVKMILPFGHEVGSHGYSHEVDMAFDVLPLEEQIYQLQKSKKILEDISGQEVVSFRAPAARVNNDTAVALKEAGFKIDSSIASQRFDMFLTYGNREKLKWLAAPRLPYFTHPKSLFKKGSGDILEIPISASIIPYIGTTLRILPGMTRLIGRFLHFENLMNGKPIVFLTHPNEYIIESLGDGKINRRSSNYFSYLFGDVLRRRLKLRNLGPNGLKLYEKEIAFFKKKNYTFTTCKDYYMYYESKLDKNAGK